jgi:hypothetical protein
MVVTELLRVSGEKTFRDPEVQSCIRAGRGERAW